jgi:hypothetical protein
MFDSANLGKLTVEVHRMLDLPLPEPKDPRQGNRTGFSFARFAIPQPRARRARDDDAAGRE